MLTAASSPPQIPNESLRALEVIPGKNTKGKELRPDQPKSLGPRRTKKHTTKEWNPTALFGTASTVDGVETALKSLSVGASFFKPPSEITIVQSGIRPLTEATINFMADMKVTTQEGNPDRVDDQIVLDHVTQLQVYAKCALARRRGPFERDLVNTIVSQLSVSLKSTAAYLQNIGVCEVAGQQIFPTLSTNPAVQKPPLGWTETKIRTDEGTLFVNIAGIDPPPNVNSFQDLINLPQANRQFFQAGLTNMSDTIVVVPIDLERFTRHQRIIIRRTNVFVIRPSDDEYYSCCIHFKGIANYQTAI